VRALGDAGHDVVWVRTAAPGMGDAEVLTWAVREQRILLTFDKDFAELARAAVLPPSVGVVLFRMTPPRATEIGQYLTAVVMGRDDWAGHFSVIEPGRVRMRPLRTR
jgi:predicted nuclease of predicted toxin-antitoxin system